LTAPTLIVAAPQSGSGKTLLTLGLIRALARRGLKVGSFKVGPDYIDPAFHARASGQSCRNLDSWAMRFETLAALLEDAGRDVDIVVGEGVMGLFDGAPDGSGSTADIAALFDLPVVLVAEARRINQSIAALLEGFIGFRQDVEVVGIVLNAVAGERHAATLLKACDERFSTPVLGWLPRHDELVVPSRHLGLVQAAEHPALDELIERLGSLVAERLDLDRLLRLARRPGVAGLGGQGARPIAALGQRIAVAQDTAFAFAYPAVLEGWRRQGAEIVPFSPLADEAPDPAADAIYLPGGYPELYAGRLAANRQFLLGLQAAAYRDVFIYGECGGYMALGEVLIDAAGERHRLAELLPVVTSFEAPKLRLGYREVTLLGPSPLGRPPLRYRGHEFHYAREVEQRGVPFLRASDASGRQLGEAGCRLGTVAGSFIHLVDRWPHLVVVR